MEIENRVAASGLITLSLEDFYQKGERTSIDIQPVLWQGLALKEKDFRTFVKDHDWSQYQGKFVAIHCSVDAIIPSWAFMLLTVNLMPYAKKVVYGSLQDLERELFIDSINSIDEEEYRDKRILVKGCGELEIPESAFSKMVEKLHPVVKSLMFGEACSNVPLYKRK